MSISFLASVPLYSKKNRSTYALEPMRNYNLTNASINLTNLLKKNIISLKTISTPPKIGENTLDDICRKFHSKHKFNELNKTMKEDKLRFSMIQDKNKTKPIFKDITNSTKYLRRRRIIRNKSIMFAKKKLPKVNISLIESNQQQLIKVTSIKLKKINKPRFNKTEILPTIKSTRNKQILKTNIENERTLQEIDNYLRPITKGRIIIKPKNNPDFIYN